MRAFISATVLATILQHVILALGSTAPAFMWSPHIDMTIQEAVNYQTISNEDLAKSILSEGGWSDILCAGKNLHQMIDAAFVFVGKELQSSDLAGNNDEATLLNFLKDSFMKSNFSMAFPYVAVTDEKGTVENSLLAEFKDKCEDGLGVNVVLMGSCSVDGKDDKDVTELDTLVLRMDKGKKHLVVYCNGDFRLSSRPDELHSESGIFSNVISSLENVGLKYAALYISNPFNPVQNPSSHQMKRFLAESGNSSVNSTMCDGVCQIKTSLLEAVFVAIVLLIILISGLCCMMGIDTPTRFEAPQES